MNNVKFGILDKESCFTPCLDMRLKLLPAALITMVLTSPVVAKMVFASSGKVPIWNRKWSLVGEIVRMHSRTVKPFRNKKIDTILTMKVSSRKFTKINIRKKKWEIGIRLVK